MSARLISFRDLLTQCAVSCGLDPDRLGAGEGAALAVHLTKAVDTEWRADEWPGAVRVVRRYFAPAWSGAPSYVEGDTVVTLDGDGAPTYYVALASAFKILGTLAARSDLGATWGYQYPGVLPPIGQTVADEAGNLGTVTNTGAMDESTYVFEVAKTDAFAPAVASIMRRVYVPGVPITLIDPAEVWAETTDYVRTFALEASGQTAILDVLSLWDRQPETGKCAKPLGFTLGHFAGAEAVYLEPCRPAVSSVWVRFRKRPPQFTISLWNAGSSYAVDALAVVWPDCWRCVTASTGAPQGPADAPARWEKQEVPELLRDIVQLKAAQAWLKANGRYAQAGALKTELEEAEDRASEVLHVQQGQGRRFAVATGKRATDRNRFQPRRGAH